jgi:Fe2+ or Zn2+ uptake regulation protein
MRSPAELTRLFRAHGRKVTPQRQCIFRALQVASRRPSADRDPAADGHPSAERIHAIVRAEMETVSLKTVYSTLHDLVELGEVAALEVGTGAARYDPNVERTHHHLVCRSCGTVRDLFVDLPMAELPPGLAQGYDVERREVVFRGLCGDCRAASPPARTAAPLDATVLAGGDRARGVHRSPDHRHPDRPPHHPLTTTRHAASSTRRSNAPAQGL